MSLIPSESYSFPDHFTSTRAAARKLKSIEPEAEAVEPPPKKPAIVALPNPEPQPQPRPAPVAAVRQNPELLRKLAPPVPNPALRRASAPPPRIAESPVRKMALPPTLKPKVRWNNRAPAMNPVPPTANNGDGNGPEQIVPEVPPMPARNVIQMQRPPLPQVLPRPENVASRPVVQPRTQIRPENLRPQTSPPVAPTKPAARTLPLAPRAARSPQSQLVPHAPAAVPGTAPQADFFETFEQSGETIIANQRRKEKMRRFIVCESIAVGVLLPLVLLGLLFHPQNAALLWIMSIVTISAAVAAALIPIVFFAVAPTLPEIER